MVVAEPKCKIREVREVRATVIRVYPFIVQKENGDLAYPTAVQWPYITIVGWGGYVVGNQWYPDRSESSRSGREA